MNISQETVDAISSVFNVNSIPAAEISAKFASKARKPAKVVKSTEPKERVKRVGTKQEAAMGIFQRHNGNRKAVIADIKNELGMSDAGATTYFYNAKRFCK
jgi:hypothetical protein